MGQAWGFSAKIGILKGGKGGFPRVVGVGEGGEPWSDVGIWADECGSEVVLASVARRGGLVNRNLLGFSNCFSRNRYDTSPPHFLCESVPYCPCEIHMHSVRHPVVLEVIVAHTKCCTDMESLDSRRCDHEHADVLGIITPLVEHESRVAVGVGDAP